MDKVERSREEAAKEIDALRTMGFEEFREAVAGMFTAHLGILPLIADEIGKENHKFKNTMIKAFKKANREEMDAALAAYRNLTDRTTMLEWCMYSVFVMSRRHILKHRVTNEDMDKIAALFDLNITEARKEYRCDQIWRILEDLTDTGAERLDTQTLNTILEVYFENPEPFKTYIAIKQKGRPDLVALMEKGIQRLARGMDEDDLEGTEADLQKMLADYRMTRQEAANVE